MTVTTMRTSPDSPPVVQARRARSACDLQALWMPPDDWLLRLPFSGAADPYTAISLADTTDIIVAMLQEEDLAHAHADTQRQLGRWPGRKRPAESLRLSAHMRNEEQQE